jgi:hypothetical protein
MNNHEETSRARAMRLLALMRERTEHTHEPVRVAELAAACQLSTSEAEAAWRYLCDIGLIDTFSVPYTARINAKGIDALESETDSRSDDGTPREGADTVRGYGRVDAQEALDRAREVSKELDRLHLFLPKLTDSELSAYSTKSLPIGTFLQSKGQTFSMLTEDMLASAFKEEVERRKETRLDRWLKRAKNNPIGAALVILSLVAGGVAAFYESASKIKSAVYAPTTTANVNPPTIATSPSEACETDTDARPPTDVGTYQVHDP